jgi:hypothetical protein
MTLDPTCTFSLMLLEEGVVVVAAAWAVVEQRKVGKGSS